MKYTPYKDALYKPKMRARLIKTPNLKKILRINLSRRIDAYLRSIVKPPEGFKQNTNTVISIHGFTGSGKSILAMTLGKKYFINFNHQNVFFYDQKILENVEQFEPNSMLIRDENPSGAMFGLGSNRIKSEITKLTETCRKAGLNLTLIEPSYRHNPITKLYIETLDMDINNRISRALVIDSITEQYIGVIYINILPEDDYDWIQYNKAKDKFIEEMKKRDTTQGREDYNSLAMDVINDPEFANFRSKKERKVYIIQKFPRLTTKEADLLNTVVDVKLRGLV